MTASLKGFILAGIDGSELGDAVVEHAVWVSKSSQLPILFLHTIEHSHLSEHPHHEGNLTPNMKEQLLNELSDEERQESKRLIAEGKAILDKAKQKAEQAGLTGSVTKQRHGTLPEALIDLEPEAAMVILGAKGESHSGEKKGLGSQLEDAIRAIHTPVFIVKENFKQPKSLMFAYNGSPTSITALDLIKQGALGDSSLEIHLVSVQKNLDDAQALVDDARAVLAEANIKVTTKAVVGEAVEELTRYQQQKDIDITAMGAFSHGQLHGFFFGSFTTRMLLESSTNFLLIR